MLFFKTAHIQIRFLGKDPVFKYGFLVLFSHPCKMSLFRKDLKIDQMLIFPHLPLFALPVSEDPP